MVVVGGVCGDVSFDPGAACSMNPAALVLAITNHLGRAGLSFVVDVHASRRSQNHPVGRATVRALGVPRPVDQPIDVSMRAPAVSLQDVEIVLELGSTTAPNALGDHLIDAGLYAPVGFISE